MLTGETRWITIQIYIIKLSMFQDILNQGDIAESPELKPEENSLIESMTLDEAEVIGDAFFGTKEDIRYTILRRVGLKPGDKDFVYNRFFDRLFELFDELPGKRGHKKRLRAVVFPELVDYAINGEGRYLYDDRAVIQWCHKQNLSLSDLAGETAEKTVFSFFADTLGDRAFIKRTAHVMSEETGLMTGGLVSYIPCRLEEGTAKLDEAHAFSIYKKIRNSRDDGGIFLVPSFAVTADACSIQRIYLPQGTQL